MTESEKKTIELREKQMKEVEELARPLIKYLCENFHPHVTAIITPTSFEVTEGLIANPNIDDYIVD